MIRRTVRFLDQRSAAAPLIKKTLRYVFPDHWSFLLGEVALYSFIVLVGTGIFLTFFFKPSHAETVYHGVYQPLKGFPMTEAYKSVVDISFNVRAGLLMRQTHHWAANIFVASIVLHLMRIFFTGAFRKPRELTYLIGLTMLVLALLEGYLGYSLIDDLLSGMGLAIGYGVALSVPLVGGNLSLLIWGAPYPGDDSFWSRMFITHVLILPVAIGILISVHLALVASRHHSQFKREQRQTERRLVGVPAFPGQAPRSLGLFCGVVALLFGLGGLVQINPIWLWGPYEISQATNGAQPDWYLGWLIGALRLVPGFDLTIGDYTLIPNPFWGGILFPGIVFTVLGAWPFLERRLARDQRFHNLLDRPRDAPFRTGFGMGLLTWVVLIFIAGSSDRADVFFGVSYVDQIYVYRVLVWVLPLLVGWFTWRICKELQRAERVEEIQEEAESEGRAQPARP